MSVPAVPVARYPRRQEAEPALPLDCPPPLLHQAVGSSFQDRSSGGRQVQSTATAPALVPLRISSNLFSTPPSRRGTNIAPPPSRMVVAMPNIQASLYRPPVLTVGVQRDQPSASTNIPRMSLVRHYQTSNTHLPDVSSRQPPPGMSMSHLSVAQCPTPPLTGRQSPRMSGKVSPPTNRGKSPMPPSKSPQPQTAISEQEPEQPPEEKVEFMASLGLITHATLKEVQEQLELRKRSHNHDNHVAEDAEVPAKRPADMPDSVAQRRGHSARQAGFVDSVASGFSNHLVAVTTGGAASSAYPGTVTGAMRSEGMSKEIQTFDGPETKKYLCQTENIGAITDRDCRAVCFSCHVSGELVSCDVCLHMFHIHCLTTTSSGQPCGMWLCQRCRDEMNHLQLRSWPGLLIIVNSYLSHNAVREHDVENMRERVDYSRRITANLHSEIHELNELRQKRAAHKRDLEQGHQDLLAQEESLLKAVTALKRL